MAMAVVVAVNDAVAGEIMADVNVNVNHAVAVVDNVIESKLNADFGASSLCDEQDAEAQQLLTWRLDQFESHADWTVIIEHTNNNDNANANANANTIADMDMAMMDTIDMDMMDLQQEGQKSPKYHVHKTMLGVGPYKSNYFGALFKHYSDSCCRYIVPEEYHLIETQDSTSILRVDSAAQEYAVPVLLDYIYSRGMVESFSTQNAVAVKSLASYLGCCKLLQAVTEFIERDLSVKNCTYYLRSSASASHSYISHRSSSGHADVDADADVLACHEEEVFQKATTLCAKSFEHLKRDDLLALGPTLFETVVLSPGLVCVGDELSCRVAEYCRESTHKDSTQLTSKWLASVTHPNHMPSIFPGEGLFLLNKAQELFTATTTRCTSTSSTLGGEEGDEENANDDQTKKGNHTEEVEYKALQDRCIDAVSEYWSELLVVQSDDSHTTASLENQKLFSKLSNNLKDRILQAATKVAQEEVDVLKKELLRVGGRPHTMMMPVVPVVNTDNNATANQANNSNSNNSPTSCCTATQLQMVLQSLILQISHLEEEVRVQRQRQRHAGRAKRRKQKQ